MRSNQSIQIRNNQWEFGVFFLSLACMTNDILCTHKHLSFSEILTPFSHHPFFDFQARQLVKASEANWQMIANNTTDSIQGKCSYKDVIRTERRDAVCSGLYVITT